MGDPMANQSNPGKSESKSGAVPGWWPPLRKRLAERLRQHQENQRVASRKRLPRECKEWIKEAKAAGIIPGKRRTGGVTPGSFYPAYEKLLSSLGGNARRERFRRSLIARTPIIPIGTETRSAMTTGILAAFWFGLAAMKAF